MPLGFENQWEDGTQAAGTTQQQSRSVLGPGELASLAAAAFKEPLSSALGTSDLRPTPPPTLPLQKPKPRGSWVTFDKLGSGDSSTAMPIPRADTDLGTLDTAPSAFSEPGKEPTPFGPSLGFEDSSFTVERGGGFSRAGGGFDEGDAFGAPFPERSAPVASAADWAENGGEWAPTSTAADWADDAEFQAPNTNFGFAPLVRPDCMVSG